MVTNEKEEIWTLSNQSFISLTYTLKQSVIEQHKPLKPPIDINSNLAKSVNFNVTMKTPNKKNTFLNFFSNHKSQNLNNSNVQKQKEKDNESNQSPKSTKKPKGFFSNLFSSSHKTPSKVQVSQDIKNLTSFQSASLSSPSTSVSPSQSYEIIEGNSNITLFSSERSKDVHFLEAVFISGLDKNTNKLIPNTADFPSPCGHKECSALHAMKSSLLQVHKSSNVFINDHFSTFAFPLGIKICYKCIFENKNVENVPKPYQIFFNVINNEEGDKKYIVTLHYFRKISTKDFESEYKINPIKEHTILLNQNEDNAFTDEKIQKDFSLISEFILNENVLIPESISLLSKYPYIEQMIVCLKNIMAVPKEETGTMISHIVNEILLPQTLNTHVIFYLPRSVTPIKLQSPIYNKYLSPNQNKLTDINYAILFKYFTISKIIKIFSLLLLESKILFIHNDYKILSEIEYIFINLIYPIKWEGTFIPVLSLSMYQFLQSLFPFVMGIDENLLNLSLKQNAITPSQSGISFVFIGNDKKIISNAKIPEMPSKVVDYLQNGLKNIKKEIEKKIISQDEVNEKIRNIFLQVVIMFIGEYKRFVYYSDNEEIPYFDKDGYVNMFKADNSTKETSFSKFVTEIVLTQNFNQFLLSAKNNYFDQKEYFNTEIEKNILQSFTSSSSGLTKSRFRSSSAARASSITKDTNERSSSRNSYTRNNDANLRNPFNPNEFLSQTKNDVFSLLSPNSSLHSEMNYNMNRITVNGPIPSLNNNVKKSNEGNDKQYLLFPYFIRFSVDKKKIEEYIKKYLKTRKFYDVLNDEEHCYIIPSNSKKFDFVNIQETNKRYIIPNKDIDSVKEDLNVNTFSLEEKKEEMSDVLTEKEKKSITDLFLYLLIRKNYSYAISEEELKKIKDKVDSALKNYFSDSNQIEKIKYKMFFGNFLVYQNRLYTEKQFKLITNDTFDKLFIITKNSLSISPILFNGVINDKVFLFYKLYTLISFSFYKVVNDKSKKTNSFFIYEELNLKKISCDIWLDEEFWRFFICDEKKKQFEEDPFEIVRSVCNIMKKLHLSLSFIKKTLLGEFGMRILSSEEKYESLEHLVEMEED